MNKVKRIERSAEGQDPGGSPHMEALGEGEWGEAAEKVAMQLGD